FYFKKKTAHVTGHVGGSLLRISLGLAGRPGELSSAKHMRVQVRYALARRLAGIYHHTVSAFSNIQLIGYLGRDVQQVSHQRDVQLGHVVERLQIVFAWNQHYVYRRLRIDIFDCNDLFVLVDKTSRRIVCDDAAKNATLFVCVVHISRGYYQLAITFESNTIDWFLRIIVQELQLTLLAKQDLQK